MNPSFFLFGLLFVAIYLLLCFYVGIRSFQTLKAFIKIKSIIFWPTYIIIAFSYIINRALGINIYILELIGSYWIAAFMYLLLFFSLFDLLGMAIRILNSVFAASERLSLLELRWKTKRIYFLVFIFTGVILLSGTWAARNPAVSTYDVQINKKVAGIQQLKIAFISDLHIEKSAKTEYMEIAAENISALNPDIIMMGGDILESNLSAANEKKLEAVLNKLRAKYGIYAVLGNHEYYGGQADQITSYLQDKGIRVLRDQICESINGQIYIAGRNEENFGQASTEVRRPLSDIFNGIDNSRPIILLDHEPKTVEEAENAGVDLMLSGHTHGGQLFPIQIITKAIYVVDRGLWQKDSFNLVVSTGLGLWGTPVRTASRSEIVVINLIFAQ